jgi:arginase
MVELPVRSLVLIDVPFNSAGRAGGVAGMPAALRSAGLIERLSSLARVVESSVIVDQLTTERGPSGLIAEEALTEMVLEVSNTVGDAMRHASFVALIAGDCPALLGGLIGKRASGDVTGLVFIDGHEDAWDPTRSPTGEASDSEIGLALGLVAPPTGLANVLPCLAPEHVALLGPRDADELADAGVASIADKVRVRSGAELAASSLWEVGRAEAARIAALVRSWWLHVDLDVLSTDALDAVDYRQPGGLDWEQLEELTSAALSIGGCYGASVVIYNPELDKGRAASRIADYVASLAARAVGHS